VPKRRPLSLSDLAQRKVIMPHFNDLVIVREAISELEKSPQGLTDDKLVGALHKRGVIPGTDPRRGRNIFEAALYLGLVRRKVNRELLYYASPLGKELLLLKGQREKLTGPEKEFFADRAIRFKIPNATHYQEPLLVRERIRTRFKHFYLTKRVRPFAVFMKSVTSIGGGIHRDDFVKLATAAMLCEDESSQSMTEAKKEIDRIASKHGIDESMSPFRDGQVLTSWSEQLGLFQRDKDEFTITDFGNEILKEIENAIPVWWLDLSATHHATILLTLLQARSQMQKISLKELEQAFATNLSVPNISDDLRELARYGVMTEGGEVALVRDPLFELEYDVPEQAHVLVRGQVTAITNSLTKKVAVFAPKPVVRPTPEVRIAYSVVPQELLEIPMLASRNVEMLDKYGEKEVSDTFEDRVYKAFGFLGFEVMQLGHLRPWRSLPDSAILDSSPLWARQTPYAVLTDCKSSERPYGLSKADGRAISEYIEQSYDKLILDRFLLKYFLLIGPNFVSDIGDKLAEIEGARRYGVHVVAFEAEALMRLVELHAQTPFVLSRGYLRLDQILDSAIRQRTCVVSASLVNTLFTQQRPRMPGMLYQS